VFTFLLDTSNENGAAHENGLNWELFGPRNNRFFLASGSIGPAYMNSKSTLGSDGCDLEQLVDFNNEDKKKLHISTQKCPMLLRKNLHEMFPAPEVLTENDKLTLITLSQASAAPITAADHEKAAIKFVIAAREICSRLRLHGFWSDFLNPMSGRPFHSYHQKSLYKLNDERFRGLCMQFEEIKADGAEENCLLICEDKSTKFSGSIYSNIPANIELIKDLILDD
jgi:Methylmalonic aciduria and homocystinuria type D protein